MSGVDKIAWGAELRRLRNAKGLSQRAVAARVPGSYPQKQHNWEQGSIPSREDVVALEATLDVHDGRLLRLAGYDPASEDLAERVARLERSISWLTEVVETRLPVPEGSTGGGGGRGR